MLKFWMWLYGFLQATQSQKRGAQRTVAFLDAVDPDSCLKVVAHSCRALKRRVRTTSCAAQAMLRIVRRFAGHSHFANIQKKKGGKDAARAKVFEKLAKTIETSSRLAGGDRADPALASALSRARDASMPKKTVDAAVSRGGADESAGAGLEELVYEGTLPGGVGVIIDALSDNKNRTAGEVRATFKKYDGSLGAPGSVAWNWSRVAELRPTAPEGGFDDAARELLFLTAVEAGADDIVDDAVLADIALSSSIRDALDAAGFVVDATERVWMPEDRADAAAPLDALDALDALDDVSVVWHNARS